MLSCNDVKQTFKDTFNGEYSNDDNSNGRSAGKRTSTGEQEEEKRAKKNFLADRQALVKAQEKLQGLPKFKNKEIMLLSSIDFYDDGRIYIQLQDPDIPEHVDEYTYRDGRWKDPTPVQISGNNDLKKSLFSLAEINFGSVASIFDQVAVKSGEIEGVEEVTHIYFVHSAAFGRKQWYASMSGTRESYSVRADITGDSVSFKRN